MIHRNRKAGIQSAVSLFLIVIACIYIAETSIMFVLHVLLPLSGWTEILVDSTLLVVVLFPVLYSFMLRPMALHIRDLTEAQAALREEREGLEMRVRERTAELANSNEKLQTEVAGHKRTLAELQEAKTRYGTLFLQSPDGVLIIDPETALPLEFNDKAHNQLGYSRDEFARLRIFDYEAAEKPEETRAHIEEILHEGIVEFETRHRTKKGEIRNVQVIIQTIPLSGLPYFHCIFRDITGRKKAEAAIEAAARLEATAVLAGGIAHQFNNLMFGLQANAELLEMKLAGNRDVLQSLTQISKSAQQATELVRQLLAFARGGKYQPKVLNLNDTIGETLRLQEKSLPPEISITRDFQPMPWPITADPAQMTQVVMNLMFNAIEAIKDRGRIIISTANILLDGSVQDLPELKQGRYVCLSVEDNGCGMSPETRARIFEPFFTTKFTGRGLGLAAVYGIVKNHGGHITVAGQEGHGSVFKIYLPAVESEIEKPREPEHAPVRGSETILLIEDEDIVRSVMQDFLQQFDYKVLIARNGREALDIVDGFDGSIDLALLDMIMPGMSGSQLYPLLKQRRPQIKVILCSGYDLDTTVEALLDAGACAFIHKPFRLDTLAAQIRKALDET